jgi:hypothetical protein
VRGISFEKYFKSLLKNVFIIITSAGNRFDETGFKNRFGTTPVSSKPV